MLVSESIDSIMRIVIFVPAGKVPLTGGAGCEVELETEAEASGRITLSVLRCKIGRSGSESWSLLELVSALRSVGPLLELESVLELPGALRRVGPLEYPPEFRLELST